MQNVPAVQQRQALIKQSIENKAADMFEILPKHVNKDRFIKSAMLAAYNNQAVQACTPISIVASVYNAAELGLDFTPAKGHAYLVPFGNEAKFMPGYRGMMELCRRTGVVKKIEAHVVHIQDTFELEYGTNSHLTHIPFLKGDPGEVIGAYAVAILENDLPIYEYMTVIELEKVRKIYRTGQKGSGPWTTWTEEMYKKTVIRRLFKYLPSSPDLDKAIEADNDLYTMPSGDGRPAPAPMVAPSADLPGSNTAPEETWPEKREPQAQPEAAPQAAAQAALQEQPKQKRKRRTKAEIEAERMAGANAGPSVGEPEAAPPPMQQPAPAAAPAPAPEQQAAGQADLF